jgi:hypothetical protein
MVYDALRATDWLVERADVDPSRIASLGISMGSTMAWWHAALDPRVKVCVDLCCMTDFQALLDTRRLDLHGLYYFLPSLLQHFTTSSINALICPRAHLCLAGTLNDMTPPAGLDRVDASLRRVYARTPESPSIGRCSATRAATSRRGRCALGSWSSWTATSD